jgi:competence protein ComEA
MLKGGSAMRTMKLIMAMLLMVTFCLVSAPGMSIAVDSKAATAKVGQASESVQKAAKDIPKNMDINTADKATLEQLPGIGPKTADAILAYRKTNGNFKSIDDLKNVKGIGEKTLEKIKPFLKKI